MTLQINCKFIDILLEVISIEVHAHSAHDAEVCQKVLNERVDEEKHMDVF